MTSSHTIDLFSSSDEPIIFPHLKKNNTDPGRKKGVRRGRPKKYKTQKAAKDAHARQKISWQKIHRPPKNQSVHFKSNTDQWETPEEVFAKLNEEFHCTTDVCADASNTKCPHFYTKEQDGLRQCWEAVCWMNPPYGKGIDLWVQKAYDASQYGVTVVCLLPANTDVQWWQRHVLPLPREDVRFIPGRLKFGGYKNSAPNGNAVVIFRPKENV